MPQKALLKTVVLRPASVRHYTRGRGRLVAARTCMSDRRRNPPGSSCMCMLRPPLVLGASARLLINPSQSHLSTLNCVCITLHPKPNLHVSTCMYAKLCTRPVHLCTCLLVSPNSPLYMCRRPFLPTPPGVCDLLPFGCTPLHLTTWACPPHSTVPSAMQRLQWVSLHRAWTMLGCLMTLCVIFCI